MYVCSCSLATECVLLLQNVFSCYRMCSLTIEFVLTPPQEKKITSSRRRAVARAQLIWSVYIHMCVCVCVCVCVCACMYICIYVIHMCTYVYIYVYIHTYMHLYIYSTYIHITQMYINVHVCVCV